MMYAQSTSDVRFPFPSSRVIGTRRNRRRRGVADTARAEHPQPAPALQRHARRLRAPALVYHRRREWRQRQEAARRAPRQGEAAAGEAGDEGGVGGLRGRASGLRDAARVARTMEDVRIVWGYGQGRPCYEVMKPQLLSVHLQER